MPATITILGLPELAAKLAALPLVAQKAAEAGRMRGALALRDLAKTQAPQLTGAMAESIEVQEEGEEVGVGEPYAPFVEGGTVYMAAEPFLGPSFDQMQDQIASEMGQSVRVALAAL